MSFLKFVLDTQWAMTHEYLQTVIAVSNRSMSDIELARKISKEREEISLRAMGELLPGTRGVVMLQGGIAVLPIVGPLFKRASFFSEISGATSIESMKADFAIARDSADVKHIIGDFDTPGGEAPGSEEFAEMIYQARGIKPLTAYVSGQCCSGGAWIASAFDERVVNGTSILGSIGVVATYYDTKKYEEDLGIEEIEIVSSNAPDKRIDPATPEGKKKIRATLDSIETVFVAALARNHGITTEKVLADFGHGGVMTGADAVKVGLADRIGFRDNLLQEIRGGKSASSKTQVAVSAPAKLVQNSPRGNDMKTENGADLVPDTDEPVVPEVAAPATPAAPVAPVVPAVADATDVSAVIAARIDGAKPGKLSKYFVASVVDRVPPTAHAALATLHAKCEAVGMDDELEAFVTAMPQLSVSQDVLPAAVVKDTTVLEGDDKGEAKTEGASFREQAQAERDAIPALKV